MNSQKYKTYSEFNNKENNDLISQSSMSILKSELDPKLINFNRRSIKSPENFISHIVRSSLLSSPSVSNARSPNIAVQSLRVWTDFQK